MKKFNKLKGFKNLKFYSQDEEQLLEVVSIFKKLGYRVVDGHFNINSAKENGGVCAWDDREITSGWLSDDDFEQVTLKELKEMLVGNKTLTWVDVFGESCLESLIKIRNLTKDKFTLDRLLGCEVVYKGESYYVGTLYNLCLGNFLVLCNSESMVHVSNLQALTFFTEDGDELTFDEYVSMYYGDNCE